MTLWLSTVLALSAVLGVPALAESTATPKADAYDEKNPQNLTADDIEGEAAIVMDYKTGRVLFEKIRTTSYTRPAPQRS